MKRKTSAAAALVAVIACPLVAHAQSVSIIGEGNPGASGATRNTTGASAYKSTTRQEDPGATTVNAGAVPSSAGRTSGTEIGTNTGTTGGGGTSGAGGGTTGTTGIAGNTGTTGTTASPGSSGTPGAGGPNSTGGTGSVGSGGTTGGSGSSGGGPAPAAAGGGGGGAAGR